MRAASLQGIPVLEQGNQEARDAHDCARADQLLKDILLLEAKERLCACVEEWHEGHFGNSWVALARAKINLDIVLGNDGGATVAAWYALVADLEERFPRMVGMSIEGEVIKAHCSVCGQNVLSCHHIARRIYCGVLCSRVVTQADQHATSIVENAAQPEARVMKVGDLDVEAEGLF